MILDYALERCLQEQKPVIIKFMDDFFFFLFGYATSTVKVL